MMTADVTHKIDLNYVCYSYSETNDVPQTQLNETRFSHFLPPQNIRPLLCGNVSMRFARVLSSFSMMLFLLLCYCQVNILKTDEPCC